MTEQVTFANVERQVVEYLDVLLAEHEPRTASYRVLPAPLPTGVFARVMLTGSRRINASQMDRQVTVEAWGTTDADAEAFGMWLYGAIGAMHLPDGTHVPDGEEGWVGGPYPDPDPATNRPRYVMTAIVRQPGIVTTL